MNEEQMFRLLSVRGRAKKGWLPVRQPRGSPGNLYRSALYNLYVQGLSTEEALEELTDALELLVEEYKKAKGG